MVPLHRVEIIIFFDYRKNLLKKAGINLEIQIVNVLCSDMLAHNVRGRLMGWTEKMPDKAEIALVSLRQILRATEISSRRLAHECGLTPSQLIILQIIARLDHPVPSAIAREASLTQATVTSLIDRLEKHGMVRRHPDTEDRRRVLIGLTEAGRSSLGGAPDLLQDRFEARFAELPEWEQSYLIAALERVAAILDAEEIDAAPVLDVGAIDKSV